MRTRTSPRGPVRIVAALLLAVTTAGAALGTAPRAAAEPATPAAPPVPAAGTATFRTVGPVRLLDTRVGDEPGPGAVVTISIADAPGLPADVDPATIVAASVTIAADRAERPGFVTAWGDGPRPETSVLNLDRAGQTRAGFAIVPVATDGDLHLYTHGGGDLVVDVTGVFTSATHARAGRFVPVPPSRVVDTRASATPFAAGEVRAVDLTPAGVPADASAAVVSLSAIGPSGWLAAWRHGVPWPGTASVTADTAGVPATATSIVPLAGGAIDVASWRGGDVVVDLLGWMTGASAADSGAGLFVPTAPTRLHDSRVAGVGPLLGGSTVTTPIPVADPGAVAAVAATVTAASARTPGFLTAHAGRTPLPDTASVNVAAGQTLATGTVLPASAAGSSLFTLGATDLVVDMTGWFTGAGGGGTGAGSVRIDAPANAFRPAMVTADGSAARWDPCTAIQVFADLNGAQPGAAAALAEALRQATRATGLEFVVHESPDRARTHGVGTLTVQWQGEGEQPAFRNGTVGLGGGSWSANRILEAWVYVDRDEPLADGAGSLLLDVLLHELGHALGLAHVDDAAQVMYPVVQRRGAYQWGDLAGLAALGASGGCTGAAGGRTSAGQGWASGFDGGAPVGAAPVQVFEAA